MGEASRSRMTFTFSNDILAEMYNTVICRIYTLLYGIKLSIKLPKAFCYRQIWICGNNIDEDKYLPFGQIETLPLGALKEQLYIYAKLVKGRNVIAIGIIMRLGLTG